MTYWAIVIGWAVLVAVLIRGIIWLAGTGWEEFEDDPEDLWEPGDGREVR